LATEAHSIFGATVLRLIIPRRRMRIGLDLRTFGVQALEPL
jgi:hypothetical protein